MDKELVGMRSHCLYVLYILKCYASYSQTAMAVPPMHHHLPGLLGL